MPLPRRLAANAGFTIVETLAAMLVLLVGVLGVIIALDAAKATTVTTRSREAATNLARELVEAARGIPYAQISDTTIPSTLQSVDAALADAAPGSEYGIRRRGFLYTVEATVCIMDDARDGGGQHDSGTFCADSAAVNAPDPDSGKPDRVPEDYKRVRVSVTWTVGGGQRTVTQTTLVNNPGSSGAPAVLTLALNGFSQPPQEVGPSATTLRFTTSTSSRPHYLRWLLDGADQGAVNLGASGTSFFFDWDVKAWNAPDAAADGVYLVTAEAFDRYSVAGPSRSLAVTLNRRRPAAVQGLAGGRTGDAIDLDWLGSPERDVEAYRVFRVAPDGSEVLVCGPVTVFTCHDHTPGTAGEVSYRVYAYDHELNQPATPRAGDPAEVTIGTGNTPPAAPVDLTLTTNGDGTVLLRWDRPSDPDGDDILFYRVYRGGQTVSDRYGRYEDTGPHATFVDAATSDGPHTYWVSAVDARYGESALSGPLTADGAR